MNILNIDLDFFLTRFIDCSSPNSGKRLNNSSIQPWKKDDVNRFLKGILNLKEPKAGKIIVNHDEVFYEWQKLIKNRLLQLPFKLVHVDMHADMGFTSTTTNCFRYFFNTFLNLDITHRGNPMRGKFGLNHGSYLLFAMGNRWISEIDFVLGEDICVTDIPDNILDDESYEKLYKKTDLYDPGDSFSIQLVQNSGIDKAFDRPDPKFSNNKNQEPKIKLNLVSKEQQIGRYKNTDWDYIFLCLSPNCTPVESDELIPLISDFIL